MSSPKYKFLNKLQGKRILIFGGTSGIGFGVAEGCFEHGASIIITGSNPDKLEKTVQRLKDSYGDLEGRVITHPCDLANEETLEDNVVKLLQAATDNGANKIGHISFSAGDGLVVDTIENITIPQLRRMEVVRFLAPVMIAKHIPKYVEKSADSSFTLTGGVGSWKPFPGRAAAAGLGARAEGLMRGLAVDLAPIRVNLVSPGAIKTELLMRVATPEVEKAWSTKTLVGRLGRPEDAAEAYLYTMKDGFVTGSIVHTDGGYLLL
jgi:NAD(P)-dependent dehydrogenase (short-subunit alcohol dehydrogenase family)